MRYIPHSDSDIKEMLQTIGVSSFEELIQFIPDELLNKDAFAEKGLSEQELIHKYRKLASENTSVFTVDSYLGAGAYEHFIPSVVDHLGSLPQFVTAYTPYQAEASQGTLQAFFEYQTLMCLLTGTDVSNASHYDGATALAEAALIAARRKPGAIVVSKYLNPEYKHVLDTYLRGTENSLTVLSPKNGLLHEESFPEALSAIIVQTPNFVGLIEDITCLSAVAKEKDALLIVCVNPISLGLLEAPGLQGADIVVGEGQPLGNPLSFGGPYFGFMCSKKEHMRKLPGRIIGQTKDHNGNTGFVLTLQAREQHIRREKATSNICSNQALCALRGAIYLSYLGEQGFKNVSRECFEKAHYLFKKLNSIQGVKPVFNSPFFHEFLICLEGKDVAMIKKELKKKNISAGVALDHYYPDFKNTLLIAVTETKSVDALDRFATELAEVMSR